MNREEKNTTQRDENDRINDPALHPVTRKNMRKTKKRLHIMQIIMIGVLTLIFVVGLMLAVMPLFEVGEIVVEGNVACTAEEIIAASGINIGDEMFSVFFDKLGETIQQNIFLECPNLRTVQVSCGFSKVTITVVEMETVMYTSTGAVWYSLNTDLRVLERNADPSAFSPFLKVKLPTVARVSVGTEIVFADQNLNYDYIVEFLNVLKENEVLDSVTYIDFSDKFSLSCVFGDQIRLEIGDLSNMETKLSRFADILREKGNEGYAVIDVSNTDKMTHQIIDFDELYN